MYKIAKEVLEDFEKRMGISKDQNYQHKVKIAGVILNLNKAASDLDNLGEAEAASVVDDALKVILDKLGAADEAIQNLLTRKAQSVVDKAIQLAKNPVLKQHLGQLDRKLTPQQLKEYFKISGWKEIPEELVPLIGRFGEKNINQNIIEKAINLVKNPALKQKLKQLDPKLTPQQLKEYFKISGWKEIPQELVPLLGKMAGKNGVEKTAGMDDWYTTYVSDLIKANKVSPLWWDLTILDAPKSLPEWAPTVDRLLQKSRALGLEYKTLVSELKNAVNQDTKWATTPEEKSHAYNESVKYLNNLIKNLAKIKKERKTLDNYKEE